MHVGILGGGQLGRMLALAGRTLGLEITVVDPDPEAPAQVAARHLCLDFDPDEVARALEGVDVVTYEFENVPVAVAERLAQEHPVHPAPTALAVAQDRLSEKTTFQTLGIETTRFMAVDSETDARRAFETLGPLVLKTRRFGYDGKGQAVVRRVEDAGPAYVSLGQVPALAEEFVPFDGELSAVLCRGQDGAFVAYPVTENTHEGGVLARSVAPARVSEAVAQAAIRAAQKLAEHLDYVGVVALEFFRVGERLLANEFAPRVHNSGHWTIEGARTSQFENHLRAVCGLPLGSAELIEPSVMVNLLGSVPAAAELLSLPDVHLHDYGKKPRQGRKVGHVTVRAPTLEEAEARAEFVTRIVQAERQRRADELE